MAVKIGGADGGYTKKKTFKIKDGRNCYRIFPSLGFNGKDPDGKPFKFYNVHYGYKNKEGKLRIFQSPLVKNRDTKMVEKPDAALERIETLKAGLESAKESKNKAVYDRLAPLVSGQKPLYNMDNNHHCIAINESGEIGFLKLRHKCKLQLDIEVKKLRAKGIEPFGAESGRFFIIDRSGTALETTFSVSIKKKTITVDGVGEVEQDIVHALTPEILSRLEAEAGDLDNLYIRPTSEEVAQIVKESELSTGISPNIDAILGKKAAVAQTVEGEEEGEEEPTATTAPSNAAPAATQAPAQSLSQAAPATTVTVQATPAPKAAAPAVSEMSDEEFLKSLG